MPPLTIAQDLGICVVYGWTVVLVLGLVWITRRR